MRLIDIDEIDIEKVYKQDEVYYLNSFRSGVASTLHYLAKMPTVDAVPVVHGRWIDVVTAEGEFWKLMHYECSNCGFNVERSYDNFCPNCGADMRERENDD